MFLFKGNRKYLHSTDIFSFFNYNYKFKNIEIFFKNFITTSPKIIKLKSISSKMSYDALVIIKNGNYTKYFVLKNSKKKIKLSYSYDENLLYKIFKISKKKVSFKGSCSIKNIDLIISMIKFWHIKNIGKKNWIVYRLKINGNILEKNYKNITIQNIKNANKKYTINSLKINNKNYGYVYFSIK